MAKIELRVIDPQKYDKGVVEDPSLITYVGTDAAVVIDTETAFIECVSQGISAAINRWEADFESYKMKLAEDEGDGNFKEIDFVAATSIVGQLIKEIGVDTLQTMLKTLNNIYKVSLPDAPSVPDVKNQESPNDDNTDN